MPLSLPYTLFKFVIALLKSAKAPLASDILAGEVTFFSSESYLDACLPIKISYWKFDNIPHPSLLPGGYFHTGSPP